MKKKFLMYLGGISFCILSLLFSYQTDVGINTTLRTESAELGDLKSQDFLIPLPVLEVEERGDEFLISLTEEAVDSLKGGIIQFYMGVRFFLMRIVLYIYQRNNLL